MECVQLDIPHMFAGSLTALTERVAGFSITQRADGEIGADARCVWIQSMGIFRSSMCFRMDETFEQAVLDGMKVGKDSSEELKQLYLGEYINILSGHALTSINNAVGETSRLTIPTVGKECMQEETRYDCYTVLYFVSEYGNMEVRLNYELSAASCENV